MAELKYDKNGRLLFTKEMKEEGYTILAPAMSPTHFDIIKNVFIHAGYNMELLDMCGPEVAQTGLKYVHNDTCYPALLVIGQFIYALQSGKYDAIYVQKDKAESFESGILESRYEELSEEDNKRIDDLIAEINSNNEE